MNEPITIVIIRALGLSGATWFNLVLGNHDEAMSMGPGDRILNLPCEEADQACFIHREHCDLWPAFLRERNHNGRFFKDLAAFTGKRIFIVNYPKSSLMTREITGQGFRVHHIRLVRDGRAALYSHMRHYGTLTPGTGVYHIIDRQIPRWETVDRKMPNDPGISMIVRYEDMVTKAQYELDRVGNFLGINYGEGAPRFWEQPQHLTAGNGGVIDLLCRLQGEAGHIVKRAEEYARLAHELLQNPKHKYLDESWIEGLSHQDKLAFDCLLGERNARYGYQRDLFSHEERETFWRNLDRHIAKARTIEEGATVEDTRNTSLPETGVFERVLSFLRRERQA